MEGLTYGRYTFNKVETFKYLGTLIHWKHEKIDINERILKGYKAFYSNKDMRQGKKLSKTKTKLQIYKSMVRPNILRSRNNDLDW